MTVGKNDAANAAAKAKRAKAKATTKKGKTAKVRPNMEIPNLACN